MASTFPDYYELLGVQQTASQDEIRQAYKKESLKSHPDRLANRPPAEVKRATERFQAVADAYYVLSDATRRREYDSLRSTRGFDERSTDPNASANFFANLANMFSGAAGAGAASGSGRGAGAGTGFADGQRPDAEGVFGDVFEDLLRPEVDRVMPFWAWFGAICGAGMGFIIANIPGLLAGAFAGNRLGAIRDAKGKSVAAVFTSLGGDQKSQILRALAAKVLGTAAASF